MVLFVCCIYRQHVLYCSSAVSIVIIYGTVRLLYLSSSCIYHHHVSIIIMYLSSVFITHKIDNCDSLFYGMKIKSNDSRIFKIFANILTEYIKATVILLLISYGNFKYNKKTYKKLFISFLIVFKIFVSQILE